MACSSFLVVATLLTVALLALCWRPAATDAAGAGLLYPRESPSRERRELSGVWNFRASPNGDQQIGFRDKWYMKPLQKTGDVIPMPVPSSFNEITQDPNLREYVGWVWYDMEFFASDRLNNTSNCKVFLYVGSAHYTATVWLNGIKVCTHEIGHLPFQCDVTKSLKYGVENRLTVAISNWLTADTVPQGHITVTNDSNYPTNFVKATYQFDFANYGGLTRPVYLYTVPATYISDVTIVTDVSQDLAKATIHYEIEYNTETPEENPTCYVELYDKNKILVTQTKGLKGNLTIDSPNLWWPYLMNDNPGYMYSMKIRLVLPSGDDVYLQPVGLREITWNGTSVAINGKPIYFRGFGKHEDYVTRGKGVDQPSIIKDFNLIKWVGANSFRTSHYPYSEEIMDRADAEGIMVIDESSACTIDTFGEALLKSHLASLTELIRRDKNRPSVVAWSISNEPDSANYKADDYFKTVAEHVRSLDKTRPITAALAANYQTDNAGEHLDFIGVNRYFSWYTNTGRLDVIQLQSVSDIEDWYGKYQKPIMMSEYGADSVPGLHSSPAYVFTEDYQVALMLENFKAFDTLREKGFFIGEHIWNFADFMTPQGYTRVLGNKKGIFTRTRDPKAAAHILRARYFDLANKIDEREEIPAQQQQYCPK